MEGIRPSVLEPERRDAPVLSMESVDSFLSFLESAGRTKQTIYTYRRCLEHLYAFLPDGKEIGEDTYSGGGRRCGRKEEPSGR